VSDAVGGVREASMGEQDEGGPEEGINGLGQTILEGVGEGVEEGLKLHWGRVELWTQVAPF
jgi:hypothetical protein